MTNELDTHKIAAARLWATQQFPYLASAIFATQVSPAPGLGGVVIDEWWRVHADPQVIEASTVAQLGGELLHLSTHVLRDHASRGRAMALTEQAELHHWVDAADAEVSDDFAHDLQRIADRVDPADLDLPTGRLAEEYYRRGAPREGECNDCGSGAHGTHPSWEPPPPQSKSDPGVMENEQELLRQKVASDIAQADADSVSANLRDWAQDRLSPQVDWRRTLAAAIRKAIATTAGAVDYSYARPSRRASISQGVIMPSLRNPTVDVTVVCDTSASVSDELLGQAMSEVDAILAGAGNRSVRVLSCDDAVRTIERVTTSRDVSLIGGGGTDMSIGLDAAVDQRPAPDLVVVLTDGYTPWPESSPRCAVVVGLLADETESYHQPTQPPDWAAVVPIKA